MFPDFSQRPQQVLDLITVGCNGPAQGRTQGTQQEGTVDLTEPSVCAAGGKLLLQDRPGRLWWSDVNNHFTNWF